jgi:DNA invertase Pin-like site-specific DNA recombinase
MTLAVAYLRVSTSRQELGPEAQRAAILAWAAKERVTVVAWHSDEISGSKGIDERPGLVAALAALRPAGAAYLVVARRDRLSRDPLVALTIERSASKSKARVVSADGIANGSDASDALLRGILDNVASYERSLIRARTKAALATKKAKGERTGTVRYGYVLGADGRSLEAAPTEQAIIARVRALRADGLSLRSIVDELALNGLVSRAGKPFGVTQIRNMVLS